MSPTQETTTAEVTSRTPGSSVTATVAMPAAPPSPGFLTQLRQGAVLGGGLIGGGGIVLGAFDLLRAEPEKSFDLLKAWGPQFLIALFALAVLKGVVDRLIGSAEKLGARFANSLDSIALEQQRLASAAEAQAAKDDREQERIATLVEYSSSSSRQALEAVTSLASVVTKISTQMDRIEQKQTEARG